MENYLHWTMFPMPPKMIPTRRVVLNSHRLLLRTASSKNAAMPTVPDISLDSFAFRQFDDPDYGGTKIQIAKEEFMRKVLTFYQERKSMADEYKDRPVLVDGYAPFCKHIFMPNIDDSIVDGAAQITPENEPLLRTAYKARSEKELPVLTRFFPKGSVSLQPSTYLDLILYSREQILKEHEATGRTEQIDDAPWRLIGIKGQAVPYEIPMNPITMMRNELISQGGSGVPIDREPYMKSVEYWKDHAVVM